MSNKYAKNGVPVFVHATKVWLMNRDQTNTVIMTDLIDKMNDLVRSDYHAKCVDGEGGCQGWNKVDNCSPQIALSKSVRALSSEINR